MNDQSRNLGIVKPIRIWEDEQVMENAKEAWEDEQLIYSAKEGFDGNVMSARTHLAKDLHDLTQNILRTFDNHVAEFHKRVARERQHSRQQDVLQTSLAESASRHDEFGAGENSTAAAQIEIEATSRPCLTLAADVVHQAAGSANFDDDKFHSASSLSSKGSAFPISTWRKKRLNRRDTCILVPSNPFLLIFNLITGIAILVGLWGDSLAIVSDWDDDAGPLGLTIENMMVGLFVLDVLINFNTAFEGDQGEINFNRRAIAKHYVRTWFIIDFFSTVPWGWIFSSLGSSRSLKLVKLAKLSRMCKMAKMSQNEQLKNVASDALDSFLASSHMNDVSISHVISAARLFMEGGSLTWQHSGLNGSILHPWLRYFLVLRWSAGAVAAGSYSDAIQTIQTHVDANVFHLCLSLCYACNVLIALSIFSNTKGSEDADVQFRMEALNVYLRRHEAVTNRTRRKVMQYFFKQQQRLHGAKLIPDMIGELSEDIRRQLFINLFGRILRECMVFSQGSFVDKKRSHIDLVEELVCVVQTGYHLADEVLIWQKCRYEGMTCIVTGRIKTHQDVARLDSNLSFLIAPHQDSKMAKEETFFGLESLFAPLDGTWQVADHTISSVSVTETVLVTRAKFDAVIMKQRHWSFFVQFVRSHVQSGEIVAGDLPNGLDASLLESFDMSYNASEERVESEDLGVCCDYLLHHFADDVATGGWELSLDDVRNMSFSQLKRFFWPRDREMDGFRGSAEYICPRDGLEGSAIVDALPDGWKGKATHFVSWCWSYTVTEVTSSLGDWTREHEEIPMGVFVWMCFFCNNQRKMLSGGYSDNLVDTFEGRLESIGHMIIVLNTHHNPHYTTRAWCIFEAYTATKRTITIDTATKRTITIDMALPTESKMELWKEIRNGNFQEIVQALTSIDAESSKASRVEDEVHIKTLIQNTIGFTAVNETVKQALTKWLVTNFEQCLIESSVSDGAHVLFSLIKGTVFADESSAHPDCRRRSITSLVVARNASGPTSEKRLSQQFNVGEWKEFAKRHPAVLDFLELDPTDLTAAFLAFGPNADGDVHIKAFDRFLNDNHKSNLNNLMLWFGTLKERPNHDEDVILESILQRGLLDSQSKVEAIKKDLTIQENVTEELAKCIGCSWALDPPEPPCTPSYSSGKRL